MFAARNISSRVYSSIKLTRSFNTFSKDIILKSRPQTNSPVQLDNFEIRNNNLSEQQDGIVLETLYISTDPYMRCKFNDDTGVDYTAPFEIGKPITSAGIGKVIKVNEKNTNYKEGDLLFSDFDAWPWAEKFTITGKEIDSKFKPVPLELLGSCPITYILGSVGLTGLSAYYGILGEVNPCKDDVVVISGAAGAVGSIAGQLALKNGSKVIGICGNNEKIKILESKLGFTKCVNYKSNDFAKELQNAIGNKRTTIYFDNVGGFVTDEVIKTMDKSSHIVLCGQISMYNTDIPYPPPLSSISQKIVDENNITRKRFLVFNYQDKFTQGLEILAKLIASGDLIVLENTLHGIENAPAAFVGMMEGNNVGKQIVKVKA